MGAEGRSSRGGRRQHGIHTKCGAAGKRLFITGIPTSGKSYLAEKLAETVGGIVIYLDDLRENLSQDEKYRAWVNFYLDQDEKTYLTSTSSDDQWENLKKQSEAIWPAIFECVNILPHLARRDLNFPGVVLVGKTLEETLRRNKEDPRWGKTEELQELEANMFFMVERPRYKAEGEKYGYPVFESADEAYDAILKTL